MIVPIVTRIVLVTSLVLRDIKNLYQLRLETPSIYGVTSNEVHILMIGDSEYLGGCKVMF